jgi:hypothetical protein
VCARAIGILGSKADVNSFVQRVPDFRNIRWTGLDFSANSEGIFGAINVKDYFPCRFVNVDEPGLCGKRTHRPFLALNFGRRVDLSISNR